MDPFPADRGLVAGPAAEGRSADLVLARVHLRMGALSLARAELESLAGKNELDDDGIRDLAEARWRTGDVAGAGEAAAAYLEADPDDVLALVIAAESQGELGRPADARRLAARALERAEASLDPVFAGMPRSQIWPVEPGSVGPVGVLFDDLHPGPRPPSSPGGATVSAAAEAIDRHRPLDPVIPAEIGGEAGRAAGGPPEGPVLWAEEPRPNDAPHADIPAGTLFQRACDALDAGRPDDAATGFLLALRAEPALAPAILDVLAGRSEPLLALIRGDAQAVVGRGAEARRDHAAAAAAFSAERPAHPADRHVLGNGHEPPPPSDSNPDQET
jgi:tetratricopeptide (TPR) repeat protein